jgi:hypothetical protein
MHAAPPAVLRTVRLPEQCADLFRIGDGGAMIHLGGDKAPLRSKATSRWARAVEIA